MLTLEQALSASEFHYGTCTRTIGPRGGVTVKSEVWRRNGQTKTWKRQPGRFLIPVKRGLRSYSSIDNYDAVHMHTAADCPLNS